MIGMYALILTVAGLIGYGIYEFYTWYVKKQAMEMMAGPQEKVKILNKILDIVHREASMGKETAITRNKVSKVLLMEQMDLRPQELKSYLATPASKNLIKETIDTVTITPFGVQFHQVFRHEFNIKSSG